MRNKPQSKDYKENVKPDFEWSNNCDLVDWNELADLYRTALLGEKPAKQLETVFSNSRYHCFVYNNARLIGVGRALADGADCSYICDIAVHPDYQGRKIGKTIVKQLIAASNGHQKIILYANHGKEGFYSKLGFYKMNTAMAIFNNTKQAIDDGIITNI